MGSVSLRRLDDRGRAASRSNHLGIAGGSHEDDDAAAGRPRIDLWYVPLDDFSPAEQADCLQLLSHDERQRHGSFKAESARQQYLAARGLVRTSLSRYRDIAPKDWRFATNRHGRPYIADCHGVSDLHFSLSHTHGMVVCAVGGVAELGVDVEHRARMGPVDDLAKSVLAPPEQVRFDALAADRRGAFFFTLWTLKEAYLKARGLGMSLPVEGVWFDVDDVRPMVHFTCAIADDPARWAFRSLRLMGYALGIAVSTSIEPHLVLRRTRPINLPAGWERGQTASGAG
ncbi:MULTISPECIES: 4'-phosphopantetheinyl transferase family protein [Nitratireductor]|uniref:4'-phosphopantetheinyl transferase family protein n=1 Tax=Nitratireductor TaxID=245876 RepID=UPI000D0CE53B|nr:MULTISPECIES: 4'-phosphopantetheinyl transferase superfamily protein [Nitratireductor]PSM16439.1 4-phosphopantetheinyl transferase [Nitratireductor sp. StC3]